MPCRRQELLNGAVAGLKSLVSVAASLQGLNYEECFHPILRFCHLRIRHGCTVLRLLMVEQPKNCHEIPAQDYEASIVVVDVVAGSGSLDHLQAASYCQDLLDRQQIDLL